MLKFLLDNALMIMLALGSGFMLFTPNRGIKGAVNLAPDAAVMLMNRASPYILDVRDANEFEAGHINGAKNIPVASLNESMKGLQKYKEKPVLVYCASGARAKTACTLLNAQGFKQINYLVGGMDAWVAVKLPAVKGV